MTTKRSTISRKLYIKLSNKIIPVLWFLPEKLAETNFLEAWWGPTIKESEPALSELFVDPSFFYLVSHLF